MGFGEEGIGRIGLCHVNWATQGCEYFFCSYLDSHFNIAILGDLIEGSHIHLNVRYGDTALV